MTSEASKRNKNVAYIWEDHCHPYHLWEWRKDVLDPLDKVMKDTSNAYTMNKSNTNAIYLELNAPDGTKWYFKQVAKRYTQLQWQKMGHSPPRVLPR